MNPKAPEFIPKKQQPASKKQTKKIHKVYSIIVCSRTFSSFPLATLTSERSGKIIMGGLYGTSIHRDFEGIAYNSFRKVAGRDASVDMITVLHTDYKNSTAYCAIFVDGSEINSYKTKGTKTANVGFTQVSFHNHVNSKLAHEHGWKVSFKFIECMRCLKNHTKKMARLNIQIEGL